MGRRPLLKLIWMKNHIPGLLSDVHEILEDYGKREVGAM